MKQIPNQSELERLIGQDDSAHDVAFPAKTPAEKEQLTEELAVLFVILCETERRNHIRVFMDTPP